MVFIQYLFVVMIVAGVALFMYKDKKSKAEEGGFGWGEILLVRINFSSYYFKDECFSCFLSLAMARPLQSKIELRSRIIEAVKV